MSDDDIIIAADEGERLGDDLRRAATTARIGDAVARQESESNE